MAVDSVGGGSGSSGNSNELAIQTRRKMIEEESNRELDRIEQKRKEQIAQTKESSRNQIAKIYENQLDEIETRSRDADERIQRAQDAANQRIRAYENEAGKMTDEAKRQFQTKANALSGHALELQRQHEQLTRQHDDQMRHLQDQHVKNVLEAKGKLDRQASEAYLSQQKNVAEIEAAGEMAMTQARQNHHQMVQQENLETKHELDALQSKREQDVIAMQKELDFTKRTGAGQIAHAQEQIKNTQTLQELEFEEKMRGITREMKGQVNRVHIQGKQSLAEAQNRYSTQLDTLEKDAKKKNQALQNRTQYNLSRMEEQAKTEEMIDQNRFDIQRKQSHEHKEKILAEARTQNEILKQKASQDYLNQSKSLNESRQQMIKGQQEQSQKDIDYQRDFAKKQINAIATQSSKTLASHASKNVDPFYQLQNINTKYAELEDSYLVQITVPEHEKDGIRISQQGNGLNVSNTRRSENKAELEDGRKIATNSYQSFSEIIPIKSKLDLKRMTRTYDNGVLTFKIPKL